MRLGIVLLLVALLLASCGGSGAPRLTYPQLQRQAGAICRHYHAALTRLGAPTSLPRIAQVARGAQRLGAVERRRLARLRPPSEGSAAYGRMLDRFARADALLPKLRQAALKGDAGTAQALAGQGQALVGAANQDAVALGLDDCRRG